MNRFGGYSTNWFQKKLGLYIGSFSLIMAVMNYSKPTAMLILGGISIVMFFTVFIRNKYTKSLQCIIMILASSLALIGNMQAYRDISLTGFPSDAILMFGFSAYTLFIYGFYDSAKTIKIIISMLFLFGAMMFPFNMFSKDIMITFACFAMFGFTMAYIAWLGYKVLTSRYQDEIQYQKGLKKKAIQEAKSAVKMSESIMKEFKKISDENDTFKAAFSEEEAAQCLTMVI